MYRGSLEGRWCAGKVVGDDGPPRRLRASFDFAPGCGKKPTRAISGPVMFPALQALAEADETR